MSGGLAPGWRISVYLLYDLVLLASAVFLVPWYLVRGWRYGKTRRGIRERLGFYLPGSLDRLAGRKVIWVHAVSVGETRAAVPLLKGLKRDHPDHLVVLSNVTETGHAIAGTIREVDLCLFFPFDVSWAVRRALLQVRPAVVVIVETEIWPNFVRVASRCGIPLVLVNGRISDRSFPRYRRVRLLLRPILRQFAALCMQTAQDAERIRLLGAPEEKIAVLPEDAVVWVAGSTHAGEEEAVAEVYRRLLNEGRSLLLVLVPRHPERCRPVADMLGSHGFPVVLRSTVERRHERLRPGEVLLVDTLGEMLMLYAAGDLVFLGGSLVSVGGHNVLEAALLKKPVIFGPFMHNFKEIANLLLSAGGGVQVEDLEGLQAAVVRLLDDPVLCRRMGEGGYSLLATNAGATRQTLAVIDRLLEH
jgi:3-deoxy-D-manno-octulosonic-acid transferase